MRRAGFITWGEYGRILEGYYKTFPREQIFVCFTTDLETAPRELMRELFSFLGVGTDFVPQSLGARYREGAASPKVGWLRSPSDLQKTLVRQPVVRSIWRSAAGEPPATRDTAPEGGQLPVRSLEQTGARIRFARAERGNPRNASSALRERPPAARGVDRPARPLARRRWGWRSLGRASLDRPLVTWSSQQRAYK